jgi:predicted neuraminidase
MPQDRSRRLLTSIAALALVAAAVPAVVRSHRPTSSPQFVMPARAGASDTRPAYSSEFLPATGAESVHAATLSQLANGDLIAAWYGGSDEAAGDVRIYSARCDHDSGRWSSPAVLETRAHTEKALGLHVKSVGNPVLFADSHGVTLFYVSILFGGWSGSSISMKTSADGVHWSSPRSVYTSPFMNVGMLVRGQPWRYSDGTVALPIYHELLRKWSAVARVDESGHVIDIVRIADSRPLIQPWIVPFTGKRAVAFLRWSAPLPGCVTLANSDDAGRNWSQTFGTRLVQRDSAVAGALLRDGSLLAIYNNSAWDRRDLSMARSTDGGIHWSRPHPLERDTNPDQSVRREYSYPYVFQTADGLYHVVYTWQRTRIRHLTFNDSWVFHDAVLGKPSA